jgi:prophage regulatory protein
MPTKTKPRSKTPAALIEANLQYHLDRALNPDLGAEQHNRENVHGARGPPQRLLSKFEMLDRVALSYPQIWRLMRRNEFPRSVVVGSDRSVAWVESEIDDWIANLPRRKLKGEKSAAR